MSVGQVERFGIVRVYVVVIAFVVSAVHLSGIFEKGIEQKLERVRGGIVEEYVGVPAVVEMDGSSVAALLDEIVETETGEVEIMT